MKWRGRLFYKYIVFFVALVAGALVLNGALDLYFVDRENRAALAIVQREKAQAASRQIEQFFQEIERQIGWTTHPQWPLMPIEQRRFDFVRLQRQVPAIADLASIDSRGREQLRVSRLLTDVMGGNADRSAEPYFIKAVANHVYFGPITFYKETEPYLTMAVAGIGRSPTVTVAEVNLKLIVDVISQINVGAGGYAYVVDIDGRLVAHPDMALVLRNTDLSHLQQVADARRSTGNSVVVEPEAVENFKGAKVLSAYAPIPALGWYVFVELPESEARRPVYDAAARTGILLLLGILIAALAAALLARRMIVPVRAMQEGVTRIGGGDLDHRLAIHTGDELESLADRFNVMAGQLKESYAGLERKVDERTHELSEALEYQTATSDVLKVMGQLNIDLAPVLQTVVTTAERLCEADRAFIFLLKDGKYHLAAANKADPAFVAFLQQNPLSPDRGTTTGRAAMDGRTAHIIDVETDAEYTMEESKSIGQQRTALGVPLLREGVVIGVITLTRAIVKPFSDKQIELVTTFAHQAVIAIENTRLFTEVQERTKDLTVALEQQTATSDVLTVISRSTSQLQPVLDAIAETAARLCQADWSAIFRLVDDKYHLVAANKMTPAYFEFLRNNPFRGDNRETMSGRVGLEGRTVHIPDVFADPEYHWPASVELGNYRTMLGVPLLRDGEVIGIIVVTRSVVKPFADSQIALVTTFADQAVIAIENVRLFEEVQARTRELGQSVAELSALGKVGQAVNSSLDLNTVLPTVLVHACEMSDSGGGAIYVFNEAAGHFDLAAGHGMSEQIIAAARALRPRVGETIVGQCAERKAAVQIADLTQEARYPLLDVLFQAGVRAILAVPMLHQDRVVGVLIVRRKRIGSFSPQTVALLQNFATQSALAILNARLFQEIKAQSRQLEIASQHKSQFLANMSHELRTPLNAILGYTEMMVDGLYGEIGDKAKTVLERVQSNGKHLLGLINDVLDLSKIEAGQLKLAIDDYRLEDVVGAVIAATESLAGAKGLRLHSSIAPALPAGRGDPRRLTQVFLNLVGNAIKFTDQGAVEIRATARDSLFEVAVVDSGPGIDAADQARIFDEFQQIDTSSTRKKGGTGLGLSISRKFVELHGGRITVESALGSGSTFKVIWPTMAQASGDAP